jgi:hypothetical protein
VIPLKTIRIVGSHTGIEPKPAPTFWQPCRQVGRSGQVRETPSPVQHEAKRKRPRLRLESRRSFEQLSPEVCSPKILTPQKHAWEWHRSARWEHRLQILRVPSSRKLYSSLISGDKICHFIRFREIRPEIRRARRP